MEAMIRVRDDVGVVGMHPGGRRCSVEALAHVVLLVGNADVAGGGMAKANGVRGDVFPARHPIYQSSNAARRLDIMKVFASCC
jgi:anaerobic selenocysteine-containing dehydrogenase